LGWTSLDHGSWIIDHGSWLLPDLRLRSHFSFCLPGVSSLSSTPGTKELLQDDSIGNRVHHGAPRMARVHLCVPTLASQESHRSTGTPSSVLKGPVDRGETLVASKCVEECRRGLDSLPTVWNRAETVRSICQAAHMAIKIDHAGR
jgi:hypothetical protein